MTTSSAARTALAATYIACFFAALLVLTLNLAMSKALNHDENMYVASGALFAREGLLPYRDYPYFQMPLTTFVFAGVFLASDHLLLAARLFSVLCALSSAGLLFYVAWRATAGRRLALRLLAGSAASLLFVMSPIFQYTSGLAWNHDLPVVLTLAAFVLLWHGGSWRLLAAGVCLGLAIDARLSFAVLWVPFAGAVLLVPTARDQRWRRVLGFVAGSALALLPVVGLFVLSPSRFVFDNVTYHTVNARYWHTLGYTRAMDLPGKITYLREVGTEAGTLLLLAAMGLLLLIWLASGRVHRWRGTSWVVVAGALALAMLAGALAPSPTWYQYFFAVVPLGILIVVALMGSLSNGQMGGVGLGVLLTAGLGATLFGLGPYLREPVLLTSSAWVPERVHSEGVQVARAAGERPVLTLAPLFALEGGASIYPELASGPFGVRNAPLLSPDERTQFDMPALADLPAILGDKPPGAILTGPEGALEAPLIEYARLHDYTPAALAGGDIFWAPPR